MVYIISTMKPFFRKDLEPMLTKHKGVLMSGTVSNPNRKTRICLRAGLHSQTCLNQTVSRQKQSQELQAIQVIVPFSLCSFIKEALVV